ncbi:MAG: hypothetical protein A3G25_13415 [Betaproteobacteria bacterium RIFCSPLOWO2_12_FULL_63_13]|nr:MAG: hypothetical protein A3G25_13415 [Betaproteobacteria bacterium RIFCSPLOWO2_12_FULL_63_13]
MPRGNPGSLDLDHTAEGEPARTVNSASCAALGASIRVDVVAMDVLVRAIEWLMTPISGAAVHHVEPWASLHGRLMVFAWAILMPIGILIARFGCARS